MWVNSEGKPSSLPTHLLLATELPDLERTLPIAIRLAGEFGAHLRIHQINPTISESAPGTIFLHEDLPFECWLLPRSIGMRAR